MWAHAMADRFGAKDPKSLMLRFHTQTGGVTLTAQQPMNNIVRVALQGFAAVCGGTQSLHTNGFDEALALPSERAAKLALRTQQVIAHESGATDTVDPFAGSYYVEALTAEIEQRAWALIEKVDEQGGSVEAIAFIKNEIEESAFGYHERYRTEQDVVVGVNRYVEDSAEVEEILSVDPRVRAPAARAAEGVQGQPRQRPHGQAPRGAQAGRAGQRQPAAADPPGAQGRRLGGRGLRRAARGLRRVSARDLKRLVEVSPEILDVLAADAQPQQRRPAPVDQRLDAAERLRVREDRHGRADRAAGRRAPRTTASPRTRP